MDYSQPLAGYKVVWRPTEAQMIDAEIAERMTCRRCGGPCRYEGYQRNGSYIALAVCKWCGREEEL